VSKAPIWDCNHPDIPPTITDSVQRCEWAKYHRAVDQGELFPSDVPVTLQLGEIADVSTQRPHNQSGFTSRGRGTSFTLDVGPDPVFVRIKLSKYAAEVRADDPAAWLRLGESSGTAVDSAGHGATPDPWSAAPAYGQPSAVGDQDDRSMTVGAGQRADVHLPSPVSTNTGASLELWVKPNPAVPNFVDFLTADTPDVWRVKMRTYNQHDGFTWGSTYGSGFGHEMVFTGFDYGQWHHLVLTMAGGVSTTYLDGRKVGERTGGDNLNLSRFTLGAHAGSSAFAGGLDELAVYPKALSAARVCAHYRAAGGSC
jgi:concanavalin A-like lectin/glucanase superfamily protein